MKYYSELLNTAYNSEAECLTAEAQYEKELAEKKKAEEEKKNERRNRAAEIEKAREEMNAAQHRYSELLSAFVKDFGTYHYSTKDVRDIPHLFFDLFNL